MKNGKLSVHDILAIAANWIAMAILSAALMASVSSCAAIQTAAAGINWWAVGANVCLRLSTTLNKRAEKAETEKAAGAEDPARPEEGVQ
jgi:hypothetical protein